MIKAKSRPASVDADVRAFLRALASEPRQNILLLHADGQAHSVGEITSALGLSMSSTSEHLAVLKDAGIMSAERDGKEIYYRPNAAVILEVMRKLNAIVSACCK